MAAVLSAPARVHLELDTTTFDASRLAAYVDRARRIAITLTTAAELGETEDTLRRLFELNRECSRDILERGEFYTWEEYHAQRIAVPGFDARGVVIAQHGTEWVGMMAMSDRRAEGFVFVEMTGVVRGWRRRVVAAATKAHGFDFAAVCGVSRVRTYHHPDNIAAISVNRSLGFVNA